jgi:hypothetical protein
MAYNHGVNRFFATLALSFWLASLPCRGQSEAPKLRLPMTVRPLRYSADLRMTPEVDLMNGNRLDCVPVLNSERRVNLPSCFKAPPQVFLDHLGSDIDKP